MHKRGRRTDGQTDRRTDMLLAIAHLMLHALHAWHRWAKNSKPQDNSIAISERLQKFTNNAISINQSINEKSDTGLKASKSVHNTLFDSTPVSGHRAN